MTYNATVKFSYTTDSQDPPSKYFLESVDRKTITIEAPGAEDLNVHQYYELFKSFLAASGFCEYSIMDGACRVAFNDSNSEAQMKKVADEYELILDEDYRKKLAEYETKQDEYVAKLEVEIRELKEKLGEVLPEQYGVTLEVLEKAYQVCKDCGTKYGEYSVGCSSTWEGECDVCGETKGVTEKRDYGYLEKGIKELSK
jgi:hypothetical protein